MAFWQIYNIDETTQQLDLSYARDLKEFENGVENRKVHFNTWC